MGQTPYYVYKLVPSSSPVPDPLPDRLPVSDLDKRSGFIHLSTATQLPNTLKSFFRDELFVYVLRIKYDDVRQDILWESPESDVCGPRYDEGLFPVRNSPFLFLSLPWAVLMSPEIASVQRTEAGKGRSGKCFRLDEHWRLGRGATTL